MKNKISSIILLVLVPVVVIGGATLFGKKQYAWISLCVTLLCCAGFFLRFERKKNNVKETVFIAAATALTVLSRCAFAGLPSFKPVSALVIVIGLYFGGETAFVVGALSAVISNFYFGQGAWTPFQMLAWGLVGFLGGVLSAPLKKHKLLLYTYGAVAGVMYSFILDIWTVIFIDGYFNLTRYAAAVISAARVTVTYAVSNVLFLMLLSKPLGYIFNRLKTKYL